MLVAKKSIFIAFCYLAIAAILGIVLRLFPITNIDATYKYIVHTHSHIALLGWVYIALTTILYHIGIEETKKRKYNLIFWSTQVTIIGMLLTFPFTGYALYSIIFSTLFLFCSYWFYFFFRKNNTLDKNAISYKFISASLLLMVISSIGPWALGAIITTLGSTSHWYHNAIYFYLHFQYNGWFIFCLLGIFFYCLEQHQIQFPIKRSKLFYQLMLISCILTVFLSFLWIQPQGIIYFLSGIGAIIQVFALLIFAKILFQLRNEITKVFTPFTLNILKFSGLLLLLKVLLQLLTALPFFVVLSTEIIDFVIGYLHLVFLGIVTPILWVFLHKFKLMSLPKIPTIVFLLGFILSEAFIIYKGIAIWKQQFIPENYFELLVIFSALMPLGILMIFIKNSTAIFSNQPKSL